MAARIGSKKVNVLDKIGLKANNFCILKTVSNKNGPDWLDCSGSENFFSTKVTNCCLVASGKTILTQ